MEQRTLEDNLGDSDITENISGLREIMFSFGFYRDGARDNARFARTRLVRESAQELFRAAGVGLTSRSEIREISEALENGWEERAQFDIVLSAVGTDSDIIKSIQSVDMGLELQTNGLIYNSTITIEVQ